MRPDSVRPVDHPIIQIYTEPNPIIHIFDMFSQFPAGGPFLPSLYVNLYLIWPASCGFVLCGLRLYVFGLGSLPFGVRAVRRVPRPSL
jgi:hypothetical protein